MGLLECGKMIANREKIDWGHWATIISVKLKKDKWPASGME